MKYILFILAALMLLISFGTAAVSKTPIHEIQAYLFGLIAAVLFVGAAIVDAIQAAAVKLFEKPEALPVTPTPLPVEAGPVDVSPQSVARGGCSKCDATIPLDSTQCPHCRTNFGPYSEWKVVPLGS